MVTQFMFLHCGTLWSPYTTMTAIPIADSHTRNNAIFHMAPVALTIIVAYVLYWCQQSRRRRVCMSMYKVLWNDFCCDCCNPGTDSHTSCCIWTDAVSASTYWNWSKRKSSLPVSIISTVWTWMVPERKSQRREATDLDEGHVGLITEEQRPSNVLKTLTVILPLSNWVDTLEQLTISYLVCLYSNGCSNG